MKKITVIIPVLNEQENVATVHRAAIEIFAGLPRYEPEIIFIDDGSTDNTLSILRSLAEVDHRVLFISFSRNFGKDNALAAGFKKSSGNAIVTMDADMQHDPSLLVNLVTQWEAGYDVVYYFRKDKNDHAGKRSQFFSAAFYKLLNIFADVKLENGISDYRILDRKVVDILASMNEDNLFYRGLVKWIGFRQLALEYSPLPRQAGDSKYKTKMLVKLAVHSITSFSTKPLTLAIYLGFIFSLMSLLYIPYAIVSKMHGVAISGWASTIVTVAFFGGLNLLILGIVGLYLGKTFIQGKGRPQFIVKETNCSRSRQQTNA